MFAQIDQTYFYRVRASSIDGLSDFSQYDTGYLQIDNSEYTHSFEWSADGKSRRGEKQAVRMVNLPTLGGVTIDNEGFVYVTSNSYKIQKFTSEGVFVDSWGIDNNAPG